MVRLIVSFLVLLLAACGGRPVPAQLGGARHETHVDGRDYVLYRRGDVVEVAQQGGAPPGDSALMRATMVGLIPWLTGCNPVAASVTGDAAAIRAKVRCPKGRR